MAMNRRGFIKGLSAAAAAILPLSTKQMSADEFEPVTKSFEPPEGPQQGRADPNMEYKDLEFRDGYWQHPDSYPIGESGWCPKTISVACSGTMTPS